MTAYFRGPKEEFHSLTSNYDTIWVKLFGYHRSTHDTIHCIDNDIKTLKFDTGFHSSNVEDKLFKHIMYRTLDNVSTPVAGNSTFVVYKADVPCTLRLLRFEDGQYNLYRFITSSNKFEKCDEDLREWRLVRHWYKDTVCSLSDKETRFTLLNTHGLQFARPVLKYLPWWMRENEEVVALNFITRSKSDSVIHLNHWVKFVFISPLSYMAYRFTYFSEYDAMRKKILETLDPKQKHLRNIPRGVLFNLVFATWVAGAIQTI